MSRFRVLNLFALALVTSLCFIGAGAAQPIASKDIPPELLPWVPWVLDQNATYSCPVVDDSAVCVWPGELSFSLDDQGGGFEERAFTDRTIEITLPGSDEHWPLDVTLDNKPVVVLESDGRPIVRAPAGEHRVQGRFLWPRLPEVLQIPETAAQVSLVVNKEPIAFPKRDSEGKLWLNMSGVEEKAGERLELDVHRRIDDAVPLRVTTRIILRTGGQAREVNLGNALLDGTVPLELSADLPARLDQGGNLILQVRAGTYKIEVTARTTSSPATLQLGKRNALWPEQEIWVWSADDNLRQVTITGAASIDPARTTLDAEWRKLPAYTMSEGNKMIVTTLRRGKPDPAPNSLNITRELWLDLDGKGYTVRDHITGTMQKEWRLDLVSGDLGHVAIAGVDQLITKAPRSGRPGVELRQATLDLAAEWRAENSLEKLPAVAWSEDVQSLRAMLNLPPGWSLFSATGVDRVETWLSDWDLLGFFFVLLVALAVGRLVGIGWGVLALLTLILCFHEEDAPYLVWLSLLIPVALLKVLPQGRIRFLVRLAWWGGIIALLVMGAPFAAQQIRTALFPQIAEYESPDQFGSAPMYPLEERLEEEKIAKTKAAIQQAAEAPKGAGAEPVEMDEEATGSPVEVAQQMAQAPMAQEKMARTRSASSSGPVAFKTRSGSLSVNAYGDTLETNRQVALKQDPTAVVQTGPGVPSWSFRSRELSWSGPVAKDHQIQLRLISPNTNRVLSFLRVIFSALLAFCLIRPSYPRQNGAALSSSKKSAPANAVVTALFVLLLLPLKAKADFPDRELLDDLSTRVTRPAACDPECVSVAALHLQIDKRNLKMTADVHAGAASSFRIPGPAQAWVPKEVRLNGKPYAAIALLKDGFLHARLAPGIHKIELMGPLPPSDSLTLTLGDAPHRVTVNADGWVVDGLREDGRAEESIQLSRQLDAAQKAKIESETLSPWLEITREFEINTTWQIRSTVRRISPTGSPIVVRFPVLKGESVTESRLSVDDNHLIISLGRDQQEFSWTSTLEKREQLSLVAANGKPWSEIWVVRCGPVWQCHFDGIAPTTHEQGGQWQPTFRPWPDEKVLVGFVKPQPAAGQSTTIDSAELEVSPGVRILKARLSLAIRSSKGGIQTVALPSKSSVQSLIIDGEQAPIRFEEDKLSFNLKPGSRRVNLEWQQSSGISVKQAVPNVGLGSPAANVRVILNLPAERWLLWTNGPSWGPAILFWGYLIFVLMVACVLPRIPNSPLKQWQWVLLGLGLTQIPIPTPLIIVGWFFVMAYRKEFEIQRPLFFDLSQLALVAWTVAAMVSLYMAVHQGLLVEPDMQVIGAGSTGERLVWYVDRVDKQLPTPWVLNVSIWVWKIAMLFWSLWLASSLVKWLPWAWRCVSAQGLWKPIWRKKAKPTPTTNEG
jgi:hypothetical protein